MNIMRTAVLIAALTALFMGIGFLIGGQSGMMIAFAVAAVMNLFGYWNADKMVLRMNNAIEVDARSAPEYYRIVQELAQRAGLPMPKVYLIDEPQPNAFATGRNPENAAVAATTGLLNALNHDEVAAVMAHELAHVQHRDTLTMTIAATLAGAISMLGNFAFFFGGNRNNPLGMIGTIAAMLVAPFAAMLIQMAVSRTREYSADRRGAEICGNPRALASALRKIASAAQRIRNPAAEANPAMAHMYIANPLHGEGMDNLFSTHPNPDNRIRALEEMARSGKFSRPASTSRKAVNTGPKVGPWGGSADADEPDQAAGPWGGAPAAPTSESKPKPQPWGRNSGSNDRWS